MSVFSLPRFSRVTVGCAVVTALTVGLGLSPAGAPALAADAGSSESVPVIGPVVSGGGSTGRIDERSGAFGLQVPVLALPGSGLPVQLSLQYNQTAAAAGLDRFGVGAGWGWGIPHVDVEGGLAVFPSSGGRYEADDSSASGLNRYPMQDVVFARTGGELPARPGIEQPLTFAYTMSYLDGTVDHFSAEGDLLARTDRAGSRVDWVWEPSHRLAAVVDSLGQRATVEWGPEVVVTSPTRSDGTAPQVTVLAESGQLSGVTDPIGNELTFDYSPQPAVPGELLTRIEADLGVLTTISYEQMTSGTPYASQVAVTDREGEALTAVQEFAMDPDNDGTDADGGSRYAGEAALFLSGDDDYRYRTRLTDGRSTAVSTFNSTHLMVERDVEVLTASGPLVVQEQRMTYPGTEDGGVVDPINLPANYGRPTGVDVLLRDAQGATRTMTQMMEFDDAGRSVEEVAADGTTTVREYGPFSMPVLETITGHDGLVTQVRTEVGAEGSVQAIVVEANTLDEPALVQVSRTEYGYDPSSPVPAAPTTVTTVEPDGRRLSTVTERVLEGAVLVEKTTDAAGSTVVTESDAVIGAPVAEIDGAGRVTTSGYDAAGRPIEQRFADGTTATTQYQILPAGGTRTVVEYSNGYAVMTEADELDRQLRKADNVAVDAERKDPEGWRTLGTSSYDEFGNVVQATDRAGRVTRTEFDAAGMPVQVTRPDGSVVKSRYNAVTGEQMQQVFLDGSATAVVTTRTAADVAGREKERSVEYTDGAGPAVSSTDYDSLGRQTRIENAGVATTMAYAASGSVAESTVRNTAGVAGPAVTATDELDGFGRSTHKTLTAPGQADRPAQHLAYDAVGRVSVETDPSGAVTERRYAADGSVEAVTRPGGFTEHFRTDSAGRTTATWFTAAGSDDRIDDRRFAYHPASGQLAAVWWADDEAGTKIGYTHTLDGLPQSMTYPDGATIRWVHNDNGELVSIVDATGTATDYTYTDLGRLDTARTVTADGTQTADVRYDYDAAGNLAGVTRGNGSSSEFDYDQAATLVAERHLDAGGHLILGLDYDRDPLGNIATVTRITPEGATSTVHEYDAHNRLVRTVQNGSGGTATDYEYTLGGELTRLTTTAGDGGRSVTEYQLDASGRPTTVVLDGASAGREYDAAGNLTVDEHGTRYSYSAANVLVSVATADGTVQTHTHWADGTHRDAVTVLPDATTSTITDRWDTSGTLPTLLNQSDADRTSIYLRGVVREHRTLLDATGALAVQGAETGYYLTDRQHSILGITDATGALDTEYRYTDYGLITTPSPGIAAATPVASVAENPHSYTGATRNPLTGHYHLATRHYDAATATFTTTDTANTLARYAYGGGNPITYTDPTGQSPSITTWLTAAFTVVALALEIAGTILTGGMLAPVLAATVAATVAAGTLEVLSFVDDGIKDIMSDEVNEALGWTSLAIGIVGGVAGGLSGGLKVAARNVGTWNLKKGMTLDVVRKPINWDRVNVAALDDHAASASANFRGQQCPVAAFTMAKSLNGRPTIANPVRSDDYMVPAPHFERQAKLGKWSPILHTTDDAVAYMDKYREGSHFVVLATSTQDGVRPKFHGVVDSIIGKEFSVGHYLNAVKGSDDIIAVDSYVGRAGHFAHEFHAAGDNQYRAPFRIMHAGTVPGSPAATL